MFLIVFMLSLAAAHHTPEHRVLLHRVQQPGVVVHHHVMEPIMYEYPVNPYAFDYVQHQPGLTASCNLLPSSQDGTVRGQVLLYQQPDQPSSLLVFGKVDGLTPGLHGFHLHRDGNTGDGCKAAGPHFNPTNATHGAPTDYSRHAGDFGNIEADASGTAGWFHFLANGISLNHGASDSVIGRAFVVHAKADDLGKGGDEESLKTGNAGGRVACCVVTLN